MSIISVFPGKGKPKLQSKTVDPTTSAKTITPDNGYDGLSSVKVNAISLQTKTVTPTESTQAISPSGGYDGLSKVTVNPIPAAYIKPNATKAAATYTPGTNDQTIAAGTYLSGKQTIKGDSDLVASNIKKGVGIFGVTGTLEQGETENLYANASGGGSTLKITSDLISKYGRAPTYVIVLQTEDGFGSGEGYGGISAAVLQGSNQSFAVWHVFSKDDNGAAFLSVSPSWLDAEVEDDTVTITSTNSSVQTRCFSGEYDVILVYEP